MFKITATLFCLVTLSTTAFAVDGITLINQATVNAAGGFPYAITQSGSYRLAGNLVVPNTAANGIVISADDVSLDLNGFLITCAAGYSSFPAGVYATNNNAHVSNGTVRGCYYGVSFGGAHSSGADRMKLIKNSEGVHSVSDVTVTSSTFQENVVFGVYMFFGGSLVVSDSTFYGNGNGGSASVRGAVRGTGSNVVISGCTFTGNGDLGSGSFDLSVLGGTVVKNTFAGNSPNPIYATALLYSENAFMTSLPVGAGLISAGNNVCYGPTPSKC